MVQIETLKLQGAALDWAVAQCEDCGIDTQAIGRGGFRQWSPSMFWSQGGPIIERERISLIPSPNWSAVHHKNLGHIYHGPTPLVAAMRCYVASKLGTHVEIPDELQPD